MCPKGEIECLRAWPATLNYVEKPAVERTNSRGREGLMARRVAIDYLRLAFGYRERGDCIPRAGVILSKVSAPPAS